MNFRNFVNDLWFQHKDEIEYFEHRLPNYDRAEWFARVRWWLRREYRRSCKEATVLDKWCQVEL